MTCIDQTFSSRYNFSVLEELPPGGRPRLYPGGASGVDGIILRVEPVSSDPWLGMFAYGRFGKDALTAVTCMPDADTLCVISRSAGYLVSASDPDRWQPVEAVPAIDIRAVSSHRLVIIASLTQLLAFGDEGLRWATGRLAWDRLQIVDVDASKLVGEYLDIRDDTMRRFEVDLASGKASSLVGEL